MPLNQRDQELAQQLEFEANRIVGALLRHPVIGPMLQEERRTSGPAVVGRRASDYRFSTEQPDRCRFE